MVFIYLKSKRCKIFDTDGFIVDELLADGSIISIDTRSRTFKKVSSVDNTSDSLYVYVEHDFFYFGRPATGEYIKYARASE